MSAGINVDDEDADIANSDTHNNNKISPSKSTKTSPSSSSSQAPDSRLKSISTMNTADPSTANSNVALRSSPLSPAFGRGNSGRTTGRITGRISMYYQSRLVPRSTINQSSVLMLRSRLGSTIRSTTGKVLISLNLSCIVCCLFVCCCLIVLFFYLLVCCYCLLSLFMLGSHTNSALNHTDREKPTTTSSKSSAQILPSKGPPAFNLLLGALAHISHASTSNSNNNNNSNMGSNRDTEEFVTTSYVPSVELCCDVHGAEMFYLFDLCCTVCENEYRSILTT